MALKSLRQAFLDGSLDRVIYPDEYLKRKVPEFVAKGDFGLASGDQPGGGFDRVWFREPVSADEVAFDAGVYLLRRERAEALGRGAVKSSTAESENLEKSDTATDNSETTDSTTDHEIDKSTEVHILRLAGSIPRELWNKFGIRIIPKLRSTQAEPQLQVNFDLELMGNGSQLMRDLLQALDDLGLSDRIEVKLK